MNRISIALAAFAIGWPVSAAIAGADDLAAGKEYFDRTCAICHGQIPDDKVAGGPDSLLVYVMQPPYGPQLKGIYGQPAGQVPLFQYSGAFKEAAPYLVWDDVTLDAFIRNSRELIGGTMMFFREADPEIRRQVILYLKANS